jgi:hypothetical protein
MKQSEKAQLAQQQAFADEFCDLEDKLLPFKANLKRRNFLRDELQKPLKPEGSLQIAGKNYVLAISPRTEQRVVLQATLPSIYQVLGPKLWAIASVSVGDLEKLLTAEAAAQYFDKVRSGSRTFHYQKRTA